MKAIRLIARIVTENIEARPVTEQLRIYNALAEILPSPEERKTAARIAWMLTEASSLQLEFSNLLNASPGITGNEPSKRSQ